MAQLARAVARFPAGVAGRWERIAESVGRTVPEVGRGAEGCQWGGEGQRVESARWGSVA